MEPAEAIRAERMGTNSPNRKCGSIRNTGRECLFFFSSRRRHTRLTCDWISDVCSSDLKQTGNPSPFTTFLFVAQPNKKSKKKKQMIRFMIFLVTLQKSFLKNFTKFTGWKNQTLLTS